MSNVIAFPNRESMEAYMNHSADRVRRGLHPVQDQITYGDHWMQVVDVSRRHVVFGRVQTLREVARAELRLGVSREDTRDVLTVTRAQMDDGLMYGWAYDKWNPGGELGHTHKLNVWPIEQAWFEEARETGWDVDELSFGAQYNLQVAWMAHRAWIRQKIDQGLV